MASQASLSQQQALARSRVQQDSARDELHSSLQQAMADAAGLREKNQKQATLLKRQARHAQMPSQLPAPLAPRRRSPPAAPPQPRRAATAAPRRAATLA